ncbi:acyl-CoA N-acyltransferase [Armillaria novae-zelandiae]|uniref:Acyl-CoA N-acyltransferase n=1 Tax=Armillaria novae-zelandiae TaxID=153914 RepID=A0AA39PDQ9_9AGAR|nr:acyl-CoA N-acyltransferase [Armillaria novae-zelandiae]
MAPAVKFCFPLPTVLESERVKLVPFDLAVHSKLLVAARSDASDYDFFPLGPYKDDEECIASLQNLPVEDSNGVAMFAVYDKTKKEEEAFAGLTGYVNSSAQDLVTEIFMFIAPVFQRTHVTSNTIGILLKYALDLDSLGLRRVTWQASTANAASIKAAERMGFRKEGVLRWCKVWPASKSRGANGIPVRKGDPKEDMLGRDTVVLSICWDDWEGGVRAHVEATMARTK